MYRTEDNDDDDDDHDQLSGFKIAVAFCSLTPEDVGQQPLRVGFPVLGPGKCNV